MITTLFFDVDGTLYDETHAKIKAEVQVAEHISDATGLPYMQVWAAYITAKNTVAYASDGDPATNDRTGWYAAMLRQLPLPGFTAEALAARYWSVVYDSIEPFYDLMHILPQLTERYDLCIITDEFRDIQLEKLRRLGLANRFRQVTSSDEAGIMKPWPGIFRLALDRAGVSAGETLMVGDNPRKDIKGARALGMGTAFIKRSRFFFYDSPPEETADITFANYTELPGLIAQLGQL